MAAKSNGKQKVGTYPNAAAHIEVTGIPLTTIADRANISTEALRRIIKGAVPSRATTIRSVINSLNALFYEPNKRPIINFDIEFKLQAPVTDVQAE